MAAKQGFSLQMETRACNFRPVRPPRDQQVRRKIAAAFALIATGFALSPCRAGTDLNGLPRYILGPAPFEDGYRWTELFDHPDEWTQTRSHVDCLLFADHQFNQFSDAQLKANFEQMQRWHLKLEMEVGAVKEWKGQSGQSTFDNQAPMWDRIERLGGNVSSLAFDEPLCNVRQYIRKPDSYALDETAKFVALVRARYPRYRLGDVEPYPFIPAQESIEWIDKLQKRLAEMRVKPLDFYRIDTDWNSFQTKTGWEDVKKIQEHCNRIGLPFGLIYWAADYGSSEATTQPSTWYDAVMSMGKAYASVGGKPDQYIMESWVDGPPHSVPETADSTLTHTALDFFRTFIKPMD